MNDEDLDRLVAASMFNNSDIHALDLSKGEAELMENIMTNTAERTDNGSRIAPGHRSRRVLVAAALSTLAIGGVAAASNLFPEDNNLLPIDQCRTEESIQEAVATLQRQNGNTVTLYTTRASEDAPINGDALVETLPDGRTSIGAGVCNPPGVMSGRGDFWLDNTGELGAESELFFPYGKAPAGATTVEIDFDRDETITLEVQSTGYFIGEFERPGTGQAPDGDEYDPQPTAIRAFDTDNNLVAAQNR